MRILKSNEIEYGRDYMIDGQRYFAYCGGSYSDRWVFVPYKNNLEVSFKAIDARDVMVTSCD